MKTKSRQIVGFCLMALPLMVLAIVLWANLGLLDTLGIFAISGIAASCMIAGVWLSIDADTDQ